MTFDPDWLRSLAGRSELLRPDEMARADAASPALGVPGPTLMANAAADSMGVVVWKLVRIKPSFGTAKTPALTGCEIFGSITHNW